MLKKLTIVLLLAFYSMASFGVSVNFFYCCGKLKNISLKAHTAAVKDCPVKKGKNCCENKMLETKIAADQKNNGFSPVSLIAPTDFSTTPPPLFGCVEEPVPVYFSDAVDEGPPGIITEKKSVLFGVFRI